MPRIKAVGVPLINYFITCFSFNLLHVFIFLSSPVAFVSLVQVLLGTELFYVKCKL